MGSTPRFTALVFLTAILGDQLTAQQGQAQEAIPNWPAPATWSGGASRGAVTALDITPAMPFVALAPCRVVNTVPGKGFTGAYGPPALAAGSPRSFFFPGRCGLPLGIQAVSVNITVTQTLGAGFLSIYPEGSPPVPPVSTLNYLANQTLANAAVVPLSFSGQATVAAGVSGTHLIIDVNGYYANELPSTTNFNVAVLGARPAIVALNTSSTCSGACGIESDIQTSGDGIAIYGSSVGSTGVNWGVAGFTASTTAGTAGVLGVQESTATTLHYDPTGVRGESISGSGVLGISRFQAVNGSLVDGSNHELAYGALGYGGYGVYSGGDFAATGAKSFVDPHPTDASKVIRYVSLEGPESGTYFRGKAKIQGGQATIEVPEDFRMVTDTEGLSIQVTPIGEIAAVAVVKINLDEIVIKGSRNVEVFYLVNGVRKTQRDFKPIAPGTEFMPRSPDAKMPAYLSEGQKAMLISNGTYREDGTVNLETASQLGWDKAWEKRGRVPEPVNVAD